jgi:hypothetical protein
MTRNDDVGRWLCVASFLLCARRDEKLKADPGQRDRPNVGLRVSGGCQPEAACMQLLCHVPLPALGNARRLHLHLEGIT